MEQGCKCTSCRLACIKKPGMFTPQQLLEFLQHIKMNLKAAIDKGLLKYDVGFINTPGGKIDPYLFVIPATQTKSDYGDFWDHRRLDPCKFLDDRGLCKLHGTPHKPAECVSLGHDINKHHATVDRICDQWEKFWEAIKKPEYEPVRYWFGKPPSLKQSKMMKRKRIDYQAEFTARTGKGMI